MSDVSDDLPLLAEGVIILRQNYGHDDEPARRAARAGMSRLLATELRLSAADAEKLLAAIDASGVRWWDEPRVEPPPKPEVEVPLVEIPARRLAPVHPLGTERITFSNSGVSPAVELLLRAVAARATDLHLDPSTGGVDVRLRVDGRLVPFGRLETKAAAALLSQYKLMADLDIADPFHVKEGRLRLPESLAGYQVRITTTRVVGGEAAALRILDSRRLTRPLDSLGMSPVALAMTFSMLEHGEGLMLVTGPTNSGKTTTVYSLLHELDNGQRNIVTIEDPVEFAIPTFRQMGVDARHDITMTSGLRTLLRMDPDIVLVGEIRDPETADIAMRAASSGRRVLSTFHTRDVASTVTALRDLKADNRSLAGNLAGIVSQRLVRRACPQCCRREAPAEREAQIFVRAGHAVPAQIAHAVGCPRCSGTGFFERVGIFEIAAGLAAVNEAIAGGATEEELRSILREARVPALLDDALDKVAQGVTTLEEVESMPWANIQGPGAHNRVALTSVPSPAARPQDNVQHEIPPGSTSRVVIFAAPDDPQVVRDCLVQQLGMHPTDAMIHAHRAPGIMPDALPSEQATALAAALCARGIKAEAVPQQDIPDIRRPEPVHHVRCREEGLDIIDLSGNVATTIPWHDLQVIAAGRVRQEEEEHLVADTPVFSYRRLTPNERMVRQLAGQEVWLLCAHPQRACRLDHARLNYEYLGERKTDSATHNFHCLLEDLLRLASSAYVTPSTRALVEHSPGRHCEFETTDELRDYALYSWLIRQRAAAGRSASS